MIFQNLQLIFQKGPARYYSSESQTSQKIPWNCPYCCLGSLVAKNRGGAALAGRIPVSSLTGGEGQVGEE